MITVSNILRKVNPIPGFCYRSEQWIVNEKGVEVIEVNIEPREGSEVHCGHCGKPAPGYDTEQRIRKWQFISLWGILVYFVYQPRRVECKHCGVRIEKIPWASGKLHICNPLRVFLAQWARLLSWREVAERFGVAWADVYGAVKWVVIYGLRHRDLNGITALGVDEVCVAKGKFWLVLYQIGEGVRREWR